jgi:SAM-dependent methyltransferase
MYSDLAPYYVHHWAPVLQPLGRQLLSHLPLSDATCVLDLGTGTGTLLDHIAKTATRAQVIAADFSEGMLRVAAASNAAGFVAADARALPLRDSSADVAISAFVLFNLPDPAAALREVLRVLRPGGAFGMTTWGEETPDQGLDAWLEELTAHGAPPGEPPPAGRERMNTTQKLAKVLREAGFDRVTTWTDGLDHTWRVADYLDFLQHWKTKARLDALPPDARRSCIARVGERMAALTPDQLTDRSQVIFATGNGPESP